MIHEVFTLIKDICISSAAIITAIVAIIGLRSWSSELRGKANFEVARKLMRSTYKLRDELSYGRSSFTSANEFPKEYDPLNHTKDEERNAWSHIFSNRWKPIATSIQEFEVQALEAEALWGTNTREICLRLKKCANQLYASMNSYLHIIDQSEEERSFIEKVKNDIWKSREEDKLSKVIQVAIDDIEELVRPHLKRKGL